MRKYKNIVGFSCCIIMSISLFGCGRSSVPPKDPYAYLAGVNVSVSPAVKERNPALYKPVKLPECTAIPEITASAGANIAETNIVRAHNEFAELIAKFKNRDITFLDQINMNSYYRNNLKKFLVDYPEVFDAYRKLVYDKLEFTYYYDISTAKGLTYDAPSKLVFCLKHPLYAYYPEYAFAKEHIGKIVNINELSVDDFCDFISGLAKYEEVYVRKEIKVYIDDLDNITFDDRILSYIFGADWESWAGKEAPYSALVRQVVQVSSAEYYDDVRYNKSSENYINILKKCIEDKDIIELFRNSKDDHEAEGIIPAVENYDELKDDEKELVNAYLKEHIELTFDDFTISSKKEDIATIRLSWKISEHLPNDRVPPSYTAYVASLTDNACYGFTELKYNVKECVFLNDKDKLNFGIVDMNGYSITTYVDEVISNVKYKVITSADLGEQPTPTPTITPTPQAGSENNNSEGISSIIQNIIDGISDLFGGNKN